MYIYGIANDDIWPTASRYSNTHQQFLYISRPLSRLSSARIYLTLPLRLPTSTLAVALLAGRQEAEDVKKCSRDRLQRPPYGAIQLQSGAPFAVAVAVRRRQTTFVWSSGWPLIPVKCCS